MYQPEKYGLALLFMILSLRSARMCLMVGTMLNEFVIGVGRPDAFSLTRDGLMKQLNDQHGENTQELYDTFSSKLGRAHITKTGTTAKVIWDMMDKKKPEQ